MGNAPAYRYKPCPVKGPDCKGECRKDAGMCSECFTRQQKADAKPTEPEEHERIEKHANGDLLTISSMSDSVTTVDQAIAKAGVDLGIWEVNKSSVSAYQSPNRDGSRQMYAVRIWLKRKVPTIITAALDELLAATPIPKAPKRKASKRKGDVLAEFSPFDLHFGKLAWARETGEDYDVDIAARRFLDATEDAIKKVAAWDVDRWLFPLGQDFFHIDNPRSETTQGTPQDTDGRWVHIYSRGIQAVEEAITRLLELAPVQVMWVRSNHDEVTGWFLTKWVEARFSADERVTVDAEPPSRKYVRHGAALIGFTHVPGVKLADLPVLMATERPEDWAATKDHEWHLGGLHKKSETRGIGDVTIRMLPSLCGTDSWHHQHGFIGGRRCAEVYLWGREEGYLGHLATGYVG